MNYIVEFSYNENIYVSSFCNFKSLKQYKEPYSWDVLTSFSSFQILLEKSHNIQVIKM